MTYNNALDASTTGGVINEKLGGLQDDISSVKGTLVQINAQLAALVRLEENHNHTVKAVDRAFKEIGSIKSDLISVEARVTSIEMHMPGLKELRRWVTGGISLALAMLLTAVVGSFISSSRKEDFMYQLILQAKQQPTTPAPPVAKVP
jgi:hypothetical protein